MNWLEPVDNYCERLGPSFWAEPLNAVTNASFIAAGVFLLLQWQHLPRRTGFGLLLVINVLIIGVGSFLFHTFANSWSSLADVLPITVFIHLYLLLAFRSYLGLNWWTSGLATLAFLATTPLIGSGLAPLMGSSAFYAPALMAIFGIGLAVRSHNAKTAKALFAAGGIFAVSIAYRAADLPLCDVHPQGTHARWHLLNGIVLYLLVRLYLKTTAAPVAR